MSDPTIINHDHTVIVEVYRQDATTLVGQVPIDVDWLPAAECARFEAVRRSTEGAAVLGSGSLDAHAVWHETLEKPYVSGFRVPVDGDVNDAPLFGLDYFKTQAHKAGSKLVESGDLQEGESFSYLVYVQARASEKPRAGRRFAVESDTQTLALRGASRVELDDGAALCGEHAEGDVPVYVPQRVLDETADALQRAGTDETGGVLVGHLCRDADDGGVFGHVTDQVPAPHTEASTTKLTFTPQTWTALDGIVRMRGEGELMLGWWHTHPARAWCSQCPIESRMKCPRSGEFFSEDDALLHRTVFSRAYSLALVVSDSYADGLTYPMFGWRRGRIERRGFHVIGAASSAERSTQPASGVAQHA